MMAIDLLLAEAALNTAPAQELERRAEALEARNVITRREWETLLAEDKRLKEQLERYSLPTQRGARNRTKTKLTEVNAKIRAVDAVIGIDA